MKVTITKIVAKTIKDIKNISLCQSTLLTMISTSHYSIVRDTKCDTVITYFLYILDDCKYKIKEILN